MTVTLVLGGARSGKSRFAESLAHGEKHYVATAQAFDDEMRDRIGRHRDRRGPDWQTHEEPLELPHRLEALSDPRAFVLVDCLTLWLSNLMLADRDWQQAGEALVAVLATQRADVVLVSNEVGMGLVPETPLGRNFRDAQGLLNQRIATVAGRVVFVTAGLPLALKGLMPPLR